MFTVRESEADGVTLGITWLDEQTTRLNFENVQKMFKFWNFVTIFRNSLRNAFTKSTNLSTIGLEIPEIAFETFAKEIDRE